jgi:hypothetical protein
MAAALCLWLEGKGLEAGRWVFDNDCGDVKISNSENLVNGLQWFFRRTTRFLLMIKAVYPSLMRFWISKLCAELENLIKDSWRFHGLYLEPWLLLLIRGQCRLGVGANDASPFDTAL